MQQLSKAALLRRIAAQWTMRPAMLCNLPPVVAPTALAALVDDKLTLSQLVRIAVVTAYKIFYSTLWRTPSTRGCGGTAASLTTVHHFAYARYDVIVFVYVQRARTQPITFP